MPGTWPALTPSASSISAAAAGFFASRWPGFLGGSIAVALASVLGGLLLSVALDIASGAAIILLGTFLFVAALAVGRIRAGRV